MSLPYSSYPTRSVICICCDAKFNTRDPRKMCCSHYCASKRYALAPIRRNWMQRIYKFGDGVTARKSYRSAMKRDPCAYCDTMAEHVDHIFPRGEHESLAENACGLCRSCNSAKHTLRPLHFLLSRDVRARMQPLVEEYRAVTGRVGQFRVAG